jgi:hypothetical protein
VRSFVLCALHFGLFEFGGERNQCRDGTDVQIEKQAIVGRATKATVGVSTACARCPMCRLLLRWLMASGRLYQLTEVHGDGSRRQNGERERGERENVARICVRVW